ncbi:MAG TPA: HAD family phosphatase [Solirubrobacterales bacterium]|jgi:beta-phosphoglucomutase-like phosphatase (HAD superfamily)|nr:HAD family phosphatase [Solirubrobacterales bacterium]
MAKAGFDPAAVEALLCDADGCLFPSEEPAFDASAKVTNEYLASIGARARYGAEELRLATTGQNFRTTAAALAEREGIAVDPLELERWVVRERYDVSSHLGQTLRPDREVTAPLWRLREGRQLALVSSSALPRIEVCLEATHLDGLFPPETRFSAESSLPQPTSKPDPAIYLFAGEQLGVEGEQGLAVEDSVPGAEAAIAAGFPTVGNVMFVPPAERPARAAALRAAGATAIIQSWSELEELLEPKTMTSTSSSASSTIRCSSSPPARVSSLPAA